MMTFAAANESRQDAYTTKDVDLATRFAALENREAFCLPLVALGQLSITNATSRVSVLVAAATLIVGDVRL
jgi:hypothetical protein